LENRDEALARSKGHNGDFDSSALPLGIFQAGASAQVPTHYEATLESLNRHPLPVWYADAKLGIFIHWGLYSVPGWAPITHPSHDFSSNMAEYYNAIPDGVIDDRFGSRTPISNRPNTRRSTRSARRSGKNTAALAALSATTGPSGKPRPSLQTN
jgi:Alpha-L-fucosidase